MIARNKMHTAAKLIKEKRLKLGMTQKELADAIGLAKNGDRTIRRWEAGETTPSMPELTCILDFPEDPPFPNNDGGRYRMIDLFAGIGGTRLGFLSTKAVNVVFSSEIDKYACKTYQANFGENPLNDITKIHACDVPDHDILVGGFPCQAFSQAGRKQGFEDTRGTLFFDIARILKEKQPRAFLLENVKNLKSHNRGRTFTTIMATLESLNYEVTTLLFKAKDFGVPQNRERVYIVGFHKETVKNFFDFQAPIPPKTPTCMGDILESDVDEKYTISDILWAGHQRRKIEHREKGNGFGFSLVGANTPYCNTISARYYKDGSEILIEQIGKNPRKVTPREAARLQGFPEEYIIPVSNAQAYKQFGNSVAVPVVAAIAKEIITVLDSSSSR